MQRIMNLTIFTYFKVTAEKILNNRINWLLRWGRHARRAGSRG